MPHVFSPRLAAALGLLLACAVAQAATDIDKLGRDCAAGNSKACSKLIAAVKKLSDQALLTEIAKTEWNPAVRAAAVKMLTDQAVLANIAKTDSEAYVRWDAVGKLSDQALLADFAKTDSDLQVRRVAAGRFIDERVRACAPSADNLPTLLKSGRVRVASDFFFINQLDARREAEIQRAGADAAKGALRSMGLNLAEDESGAEAVVEITAFGEADSARYGPLGLGPGEKRYSGAGWDGALSIRLPGGCVYRSGLLGDGIDPPQGVGSSSYINASDAPFGEALAKWVARGTTRLAQDLFGQAGVARMAKTSSHPRVRLEAVGMLTDPAVLAGIAKTDSDRDVRVAAVEKLTDQALLADIAKTASHEYVRNEAVKKLTGQAPLADIAKTDRDQDVRRAAAFKLTDQALLADIAKTDSSGSVREAAVAKLTDQALLADIARTDNSFVVREKAVALLTDQAVLADIAKTDKHSDVRGVARARLEVLQMRR